MNPTPTPSLHWSQWLCPGPRRVFSAAEMLAAGAQPWPKSVDAYVFSNLLVLLAINYNLMPRGVAVWAAVAVMFACGLSLGVARWLWFGPTRLRLNLATVAVALVFIGAAMLVRWSGIDRSTLQVPLMVMMALLVTSITAWWFLTIYRVEQIEGRLRELAEQEAALKLTRRLATAQIQPHFLFNTLASLQHWVDTQDPRAAGMLSAFTRYLRATLPMFESDSLRLDEELQIVRSYLEIMQARMGQRLSWSIYSEPGLEALQLPPGALLTLVENAIAHGIEPSLRGGSVTLSATRVDGRLRLEVRDDGAGLCEEGAGDGNSIGLANTRLRLRQLYGERARLSLSRLEPGCMSCIDIDPEPAVQETTP